MLVGALEFLFLFCRLLEKESQLLAAPYLELQVWLESVSQVSKNFLLLPLYRFLSAGPGLPLRQRHRLLSEFLCLLLVEPRSISIGVRPSLLEGSGFRPWPSPCSHVFDSQMESPPLRWEVLAFQESNPEHLRLGVSASAVHNCEHLLRWFQGLRLDWLQQPNLVALDPTTESSPSIVLEPSVWGLLSSDREK